ncbi:MAG: ABC transporter permease [Acidobacteria bacterium]|nr:ABC transporter permease [Acidobacteriota bacterium]
MKRIAGRTVYTLIVLILSSVAVFYAIRLSGGDATSARLPASASAEDRENFREVLGLNDPVYEQYFRYMGRVLTGDPGNSLTNNARISSMLAVHGKNSLILGAAAFFLVFTIGIPLGILASIRRNSWWDGGIMTFSVAGMAVPNFWLALLAVWMFASVLGWFPSAGCCGPKHLVLPATVLAMEGIALTVRMTRSAMLETLNQDFVRTLRAGGLSEMRVVSKHVLRNALVPIVSLAGLRIGQIIGYSLVVETIFGWPGIGQVLVNAVLRRDYPVAQFFSLILITIVVLSNWLADVGYTIVNPRMRKT